MRVWMEPYPWYQIKELSIFPLAILFLFIYVSRLMRDESVDGTLSPVSNKGTSEDETDNATARRKVKKYKIVFY